MSEAPHHEDLGKKEGAQPSNASSEHSETSGDDHNHNEDPLVDENTGNRKLRNTLYRRSLPDLAPKHEQFQLSQSLFDSIPENLQTCAESNTNYAWHFCREINRYQMSSKFSTLDMRALYFSLEELILGLEKLKTGLNTIEDAKQDLTAVKTKVQRLYDVVKQYEPFLLKMKFYGVTGVHKGEQDIPDNVLQKRRHSH